MKIYSMTATFGKLDHETLTLQPGLNIIEAPNEWGKSTWCAFLIAMFYGMETRTHSTRTTLADKERYAPWSGVPMSGRMDLNWNGKDITIERRSKGRGLFSEFKAYETHTGIAVDGITAENCGQILLGVEKSVFMRSGFLRLSDLPVSLDEPLKRRLNALVTTGDESGTADTLAQQLKDLKNRCRFNRTGLLPQAELQRSELTHKLRELDALQEQFHLHSERKGQLESQIANLENHRNALLYASAQEDARRVSMALEEKQRWEAALRAAEDHCSSLPEESAAIEAVQTLHMLENALSSARIEQEQLSPAPEKPVPPVAFRDLSVDEAVQTVQKDIHIFRRAEKGTYILYFLAALLCCLAGIGGYFAAKSYYALVALLPVSLLVFLGIRSLIRSQKAKKQLETKYGSRDPSVWEATLNTYSAAVESYSQTRSDWEGESIRLQQHHSLAKQKLAVFTKGKTTQEVHAHWQEVLSAYATLAEAKKEHQRCVSILALAQAMAKTATAPVYPDTLTLDAQETDRQLSEYQYEQRQLEMKLGQCLGQMEQLGNRESLQQQLDSLNARIGQLEDTYAALAIAQQTLSAASTELQRRFAPRLSRRAQEIFAGLTENRYDRFRLDEDFSLQAGTQDENTLRSILWRSDGTVDQMYLALRLAVAEELIPDAPLILDDALVRFDDKRLAAAMNTLRTTAQTRQVILFTCQSREKKY